MGLFLETQTFEKLALKRRKSKKSIMFYFFTKHGLTINDVAICIYQKLCIELMIYFGTNLDSKGGKGNSLNLFTLLTLCKKF